MVSQCLVHAHECVRLPYATGLQSLGSLSKVTLPKGTLPKGTLSEETLITLLSLLHAGEVISQEDLGVGIVNGYSLLIDDFPLIARVLVLSFDIWYKL